jgi:hypothetical protein
MTDIILRFVTQLDDPLSALIRFQAGVCEPFTPSHTEALSRDKKSYIGQHIDGGMLARPVGYDSNHKIQEILVHLPATEAQYNSFYNCIESHIGDSYDWEAILDFIDPAWNLHERKHEICSAVMSLGLCAKPNPYFAYGLAVPYYHISPRDLYLVTTSQVPNKGVI